MGVVTTLGSPWWWWTVGMGAPGRKVILRSLRLLDPGKSKEWPRVGDMEPEKIEALHPGALV